MRFRRLFIGAAALGMAAIPAATATAAPAKEAPKATGSVALSDPLQYVTFSAIGSSPAKGSISYTNFEQDSTTVSGVWDVEHWTHINFDGGYAWTLSNVERVATSTTSMTFTADATFADPTYTADVSGTLSGSNITFSFLYTGTAAGSTVTATGTLAADGSMTGSSTVYDSGSNSSFPLGWSAPAGSAEPAFSFTAPVTCVVFPALNTAIFSAVIPPASGGPAAVLGQDLAVKVVDNGEPGTNDTYGHSLGSCTQTTFSAYPVTSGNIQVKP